MTQPQSQQSASEEEQLTSSPSDDSRGAVDTFIPATTRRRLSVGMVWASLNVVGTLVLLGWVFARHVADYAGAVAVLGLAAYVFGRFLLGRRAMFRRERMLKELEAEQERRAKARRGAEASELVEAASSAPK